MMMKKRAPLAVSPKLRRLKRLYSPSSRSQSSIGIFELGCVRLSWPHLTPPLKLTLGLARSESGRKMLPRQSFATRRGLNTLDAKILSGLTNILEGDFARQTDTFKETEAHAGRLVRGRQLLLRLHNHFATNALHGSVYDMEDLMNCIMVNQNLTTFISNWDTILSGIPSPPDNTLFHRQIN